MSLILLPPNSLPARKLSTVLYPVRVVGLTAVLVSVYLAASSRMVMFSGATLSKRSRWIRCSSSRRHGPDLFPFGVKSWVVKVNE